MARSAKPQTDRLRQKLADTVIGYRTRQDYIAAVQRMMAAGGRPSYSIGSRRL